MKITIDIPDTTLAVFVSMLWDDNWHYKMVVSSLETDDLYDGNEIKLPREETNESRNSRN